MSVFARVAAIIYLVVGGTLLFVQESEQIDAQTDQEAEDIGALEEQIGDQPLGPEESLAESADAVSGGETETSADLEPEMESDRVRTSEFSSCPETPLRVSADGQRKLAFVVGINDYKSLLVSDLMGPVADSEAITSLLTSPENGFDFPRENICVLTDEQATLENFKEKFESTLTKRAEAGDLVVIFFAGHGAQVPDQNGDETADGKDEVIVLYDSLTEYGEDKLLRPLYDDEFNQMLGRLYKKTKNITLIFDSCTSATAARAGIGLSDQGSRRVEIEARYYEKFDGPPIEGADRNKHGLFAFPELVTLSGAVDNTKAFDLDPDDGVGGVFTTALVESIERSKNQAPTYEALSYLIDDIMKPLKRGRFQTARMSGRTSRLVFDFGERRKLLSHEIAKVQGTTAWTEGPALPGLGVGAVFRVYSSNSTFDDMLDPNAAKARVEVTESSGIESISSIYFGDAVDVGDVAVLEKSGADFIPISIGLSPDIDALLASNIEAQIESHPYLALLAQIVDYENADLRVDRHTETTIVIKDQGGEHTNIVSLDGGSLATIKHTTYRLTQHAFTKSLINQQSYNDDQFVDGATVTVFVDRYTGPIDRNRLICSQDNILDEWSPIELDGETIVPLCGSYDIRVKLNSYVGEPLNVGAVLLLNNGRCEVLPNLQGDIAPGAEQADRGIQALPPISSPSHIVAFATTREEKRDWRQICQFANMGERGRTIGLPRAIDDSMAPWSKTIHKLRYVSAEEFRLLSREIQLASGEEPSAATGRELTINFDIEPYLRSAEEDGALSLHRVLTVADELSLKSYTMQQSEDGVQYTQHGWEASSDEENLRLGIDCSRAIWYAFTRAGLNYNNRDKYHFSRIDHENGAYLNTAAMVGPETPMRDQFSSCMEDMRDDKLRIGDIVVYRDRTRGDGHVVMAIDPEKRIAWGSHGWDLNVNIDPRLKDTGVEYQVIRTARDWGRWDRRTMHIAGCWRHNSFDAEFQLSELVETLDVCQPKFRDSFCRIVE